MPTTEQIIKRLNKLQSILLQSELQQTNQPLYQVIKQLIQAVIDSNIGVVAITGGTGSGPISDKTYVTTGNELASLPNSSQLIAGDNIAFDTSVFGQLVLDVVLTFITNADFLTWSNESADFPNSRNVIAGSGVSFDDSVANQRTISATGTDRQWSVLTNGELINPELIFAAGDVIMTHIP